MCIETVTICLPECGHEKEIECHSKQRYNGTLYQNRFRPEYLKCMAKVVVELPCGHCRKTNCYQKTSSVQNECTEVRPCVSMRNEIPGSFFCFRSFRRVILLLL